MFDCLVRLVTYYCVLDCTGRIEGSLGLTIWRCDIY